MRDERGKELGERERNSQVMCGFCFPGLVGFIYTGLGDGRVVRLDSDLQHYTTVMRVGKPPYDQCGE